MDAVERVDDSLPEFAGLFDGGAVCEEADSGCARLCMRDRGAEGGIGDMWALKRWVRSSRVVDS